MSCGGLPPLEGHLPLPFPFFGAATGGNLVTPWRAEQRIQANLFKSSSKLFNFYSAELGGFFFSVLASMRSCLCKIYHSLKTQQLDRDNTYVHERHEDLDIVYTDGLSLLHFGQDVKP